MSSTQSQKHRYSLNELIKRLSQNNKTAFGSRLKISIMNDYNNQLENVIQYQNIDQLKQLNTKIKQQFKDTLKLSSLITIIPVAIMYKKLRPLTFMKCLKFIPLTAVFGFTIHFFASNFIAINSTLNGDIQNFLNNNSKKIVQKIIKLSQQEPPLKDNQQ